MPSKRSLSDFHNKEEFNFSIKNGRLEFSILHSKVNKTENIRFWKIYAILKDGDKDVNIYNDLIDINIFKSFSQQFNKLTIYIYTEYGIIDGKLTKTTPTILTEGKNLDKKNETSIITQSLINMRSLYLKKIKSGYTLNIDEPTDNIYPMAVHKYKDFSHKLEFPCYIQPKLDGHRVTAKLVNDEIVFLTRRLHTIYGFDNIKEECYKILKENKDMILDGEFYNHELQLQEISSIVRDENIDNSDKLKIKYYIFDYINLNEKLPFKDRIKKLENIFKDNNFKYLSLTKTYRISNKEDGNELYELFIKDGYEGAIYKNEWAEYEASNIKEIRSYNYLKRKKSYDEEFIIEGFTCGTKGKDVNAIIFIMKTQEGKIFNAVPNDTLDNRKKMYKEALKDFDNKYKGKLATVSFDDWSTNGTPLRAKFLRIFEEL